MGLLHINCINDSILLNKEVDKCCYDLFMFSVNVREELDLRAQVFFQPWHYLKQVDVEVPSIRRRSAVAIPSMGQYGVGWVANICGAPAQYGHLGDESREWCRCHG